MIIYCDDLMHHKTSLMLTKRTCYLHLIKVKKLENYSKYATKKSDKE